VTVNQWLSQATAKLRTAEIGSAALDTELILGHVLGRDRVWLQAHRDDELPAPGATAASVLIERRAAHEPLVHLTGHREFYGLDFCITKDVLTPRVETEQMVEWAVKYAPEKSSLIDIGTGSGAIAVAIKHHRPDLEVTGTEVSPQALDVARNNAKSHGVAIEFIESDLWNSIEGRFQTIVTNLPYLRDDAASQLMPEVTREPAVALFGGPDGLDLYRHFLGGLPGHLEPGGYLFTECDPWQHADLVAEAGRYGLVPVEQGYFILGFQLQAKK
jgi:release factor glutamine methyltransferase